MHRFLRVSAALVILAAAPAYAGTAEVRDAARLNNCPPKKIEVLRQTVGAASETFYLVECNLPKAKEAPADAPKPSVTIKCSQNLCQMAR